MTDEVAADDSGVAPEDRLRRELTDQLLRDMCLAERATNLQDAALFAAAKFGNFVDRLADLERSLNRFTGPTPDRVLFRLAHALAGLDEGTVDPILVPADNRRSVVDATTGKRRRGQRPGLAVNVEVARATAAAAMRILMLAGRGRKAAAQEVTKILRDRPLLTARTGEPWRVVARWREDIMKLSEKRELPDMLGQNVDFRTYAAGQFNFLVGQASRLKRDGATPEALVRLAHDQLDHGLGMGEGGHSDLARAKSGHPEG